MNNKDYISIEEYCTYYRIETSFIKKLSDHGLIELLSVNESYNIDHNQLSSLEKYIHMYYDLDINIEGIEVISRLLEKIRHLQSELSFHERRNMTA